MLDPIQLKLSYQQIYDVVCFEDLANLQVQHSAVFRTMRRYHRSVFESNQRLIFYTSHDPEQQLLDHLQRAASRVDISNWFLLLVCPFDIRHRLESANKKYGHDHTVIRSEIREISPTAAFPCKTFANTESLCPLPFMKILLNSDGSTKPCCKYSHSSGNITQSTLREIFYNDQNTTLRQQMRSGERPPGCHVCFDSELKGTTSLRQHSLTKYMDDLDSEFVDNPRLVLMDLSPSNVCNFTCRICNPANSSKIAAEELKFGDQDRRLDIRRELQIQNRPGTRQIILDNLLDIGDMRDLHVMGGEPFLWPRLPSLIQHWIDSDQAQNLRLEFNTNGSVFPQQMLSSVQQHFRVCEILLSIDNIGARFEIERGGRWLEIEHNIQQFAAIRSHNLIVKLMVTVNMQNVLYLQDLIDLCEHNNLDGIVWQYLEKPDYFCIDHAPVALRSAVIKKYQHTHDTELQGIAQRMNQGRSVDADQFLTRMDELDRRRDQSWRHTHRELAQALQACGPDS